MFKLLVFGGVGFIGTNICQLALSRGYKVTAFDNLMRKGVEDNLKILSGNENFKFIWGDVRNQSDFLELSQEVFDGMINVAADPAIPRSFTNPRQDFEISVLGQLNILDFSRERGGVPIIFASSNKVYTDRMNTVPLRETKTRYVFSSPKYEYGFNEFTDVDGVDGFTNSPYGVAKFAAEKYAREYAVHYRVPVVVNRMSNIYGLYQKGVQDQGWADWFIRAKKYGYPLSIFGDGKQTRDCLFGSDLAELYLLELELIDKLSGKVFNVGGGPNKKFNISLLEFLSYLDEKYPGPKIKMSFGPWRASDMRVYISDIRKVIKATGWKPHTDLQNGIDQIWKSLP